MPQEPEPIKARATTMRKRWRAESIALHSEQGPRDNLEDAAGWVTLRLGDQSVTGLIVCDGVCSKNHGEVCAELGVGRTCTLLSAAFAQGRLGVGRSGSSEQIRHVLLEIVSEANRAAVQRARDDPALRGMASTIVIGILHEGRIHCVWAGDSRCYLARDNRLEQITRDHRLHTEAEDSHGSRARRKTEALNSHTITQCLGNAQSFAPDYACQEVCDGDLVLLFTDGVTDTLTVEEIARHVAAWQAGDCSLDDLPQRLAEDALEAGASDNVTVLCCAYQDHSTVTMDSGAPTRTVAYPVALAASLANCSKEIINVQTHEN